MANPTQLHTGQSGPLTWTASCQDREFLSRFHAYLDQAFPLPDEKETLPGYRRIWEFLESPQGQEQTSQWGGVEEWVVLLEHDGEVVGGTNFCAIGRHSPEPMSVHGSFWFFLSPFQGQGWSRWLFGVIEQLMGRRFGPDMVLVYEMNDPLGMEVEKLQEDFQATGLHPVDRLAISMAWGDRVLDLEYFQPALGPGQEDETGLCLLVRGMEHVPGRLLLKHFDAFFTCSVLKGRNPRTIPGVARQLEALDARIRQAPLIRATRAQPWLDILRRQTDARMGGVQTPPACLGGWLVRAASED